MTNTTENKRKVLALIRVSTGEQALNDKQGVETQLDDIAYTCDEHNLEVVEEFRLIGISGATVDANPEYKRMLSRLKEPEIAGIIISRWDRWMRPEHLDQYSVFKVFRDRSKLIFTSQSERGLNPGNDDDRAIIVKGLEAANAYRKEFRRVTMRAKEKLLLVADVSVTKLPSGVEHVKQTAKYGNKTKRGVFQYTAYAFAKIRPAMLDIANGATIGSVATKYGFSSETNCRNALLNPWWIGLKTRTHKRPYKLDDTGNPFVDEATGKKVYAKRTNHDKPVSVETNLATAGPLATPLTPSAGPLVESEVYAKLLDIFVANHRTWTQQDSNTSKFLGTKFLRCEKCGKKLYLRNWMRKGQPPVYWCSGKCGFKAIRALATDEALWISAQSFFVQGGLVTAAILKSLDSTEATSRQAALQAAEQKLSDLERAKKGVLRALEVDESDDDALNRFKQIKSEIGAAKIRLATAQLQAEPFGSNDANVIANAIVARYRNIKDATMEQRQEAFDATVESIHISIEGFARFTVRGGLPVQVPFKVVPTMSKNFNPSPEDLANIAACEEDRTEYNKMETSCWKSFQFVVSLSGIRYREKFLNLQQVA